MEFWRHVFLDGEFAQRERLLSGLTLQQVISRPHGMPHSIYEELWHATAWQRIVVGRLEVGGEASMGGEPGFPAEVPDREEAWKDLVDEFLAGSEKAVVWALSPGALERELDPGVTVADELNSLAVHNAYHSGKIVALRQMIGAWPPSEVLST